MENEILYRLTSKVIGKHPNDTHGIISGRDNPISLGVRFYILESNELCGIFTPKVVHEGHIGYMHGGIITSVLDEGMGRSCMTYGETGFLEDYVNNRHQVMTGELTTRYLKPIPIDKEFRCYAKVLSKEGRKNYCEGFIVDKDNIVYAKAKGIFIDVKKINNEEFKSTLPKDALKLDENDPKEL